jgi:hypothetical protein
VLGLVTWVKALLLDEEGMEEVIGVWFVVVWLFCRTGWMRVWDGVRGN